MSTFFHKTLRISTQYSMLYVFKVKWPVFYSEWSTTIYIVPQAIPRSTAATRPGRQDSRGGGGRGGGKRPGWPLLESLPASSSSSGFYHSLYWRVLGQGPLLEDLWPTASARGPLAHSLCLRTFGPQPLLEDLRPTASTRGPLAHSLCLRTFGPQPLPEDRRPTASARGPLVRSLY